MIINILFFGFGGVALLLLLIGIVSSMGGEKNLVEERLGRYSEEETISTGTESTQAATPMTDWLNKQVEKSSWGDGISKQLAQADVKLKPGEYIATMVIAAFGIGIVAWFLGGQNLLFGLIGGIVGIFLPRLYVNREKNQRLIRFNDQLADMLNLMVNGLRAGYSTLQAMEAVSRELPPPISDEFRRVVQEMQLGVPMDRSLDNLIRRIPSDDLDLVVTAINVQREVGGNLVEILDTISYTIRERVRIKGEIRVLSAQAMYSGRFLSLLPLIVFGIIYLLSPSYMLALFTPDAGICGYIAIGLAAILIVSGYFVMMKIGEIEV
jgi:tight adherence protein B